MTTYPKIKLKYAVQLRKERVEGLEDTKPYIGLEHIESYTGRLTVSTLDNGEMPEEMVLGGESLCNLFEPGDVLFGKLRPYLAKTWVANFSGRCTTELLVMQPSLADANFLKYNFLANEFLDAVNAAAYGSKMPRADWDFIGNQEILSLPIETQRSIADYLDRETGHIDALIAAKERLLVLMAEKRQALIARAVTRGLEADVKLKDSGVAWLGEVPEGWEMVQLKFLSKIPLQYGANEAALDDNPNNPRFVRITDIDEYGNLRPETFRSLPPEVAEPYLLEDGDVLFARSGATVGKTFIYKESWGKACFAGYLIRLRCDKSRLLPDFLIAFAQSSLYWSQINEGTIQATIPNFNGEKYGAMLLALPPVDEQFLIVTQIQKQTKRLDSLRQYTEQTIGLLRERRAAVIAAAVTGKLKTSES